MSEAAAARRRSKAGEPELARRIIALLDLTDLSETATAAAIGSLCDKALTPHGPVAAVCVWPRHVAAAKARLAESPVRVATVVNFPAGGEDASRAADETAEALTDGADEIDCVLPYHALQRGDAGTAAAVLAAVRDATGARDLKVILETGALADPVLVDRASRLAIDAGADFLKTSTGKTAVSATSEAAEVMLRAIKGASRPVGFKASGGIRTLPEAALYLDLAERTMGKGWAKPSTFRIGASALFDALLAAIEGPPPA